MDLGLTYTFCQQLHEILRTAAAAKKSVVYYCANHPHKRANSAVLLLAYLVSPFLNFQIFSSLCQFLQQVAIEIATLLVDLLSDERQYRADAVCRIILRILFLFLENLPAVILIEVCISDRNII